MVFSSLTFLFVYLPAIVAIYYLMPNRILKNTCLLVGSLLFYAWGEPIYIVLMFVSTINDYSFSQLVQKEKDRDNKKKARVYFILSIVVNLALLGYFKYASFLVGNINELFQTSLVLKELPLPIGISFYTFQTMSYSIDVYLGNVKAQKNILLLGTYVVLFPQLIAGPIVRYITVEHELEHRKESFRMASDGMRRFILGLGKKVIVANQMGYIADTIINSNTGQAGTLLTWFAMVCYAFQIYYDFSGYSDMAIGLGKVFGFNFLENFSYPYVSKSITEFWRRWHISLGTWFKDYVYIPLGGNRNHPLRNIAIVWFLTGLWHGASWNYILWGIYYGILLSLEKYIFKGFLTKMPQLLQHIYALFFILLGWTIFRIEDLGQLGRVLTTLFVFRGNTMNDLLFGYQDILYAIPFLIIAIVGSLPVMKLVEKKDWHRHVAFDLSLVGIFVVSIVFLMGATFNPFIYFRF
jgi:alginate O-acetyltransferase complex protein AlgI